MAGATNSRIEYRARSAARCDATPEHLVASTYAVVLAGGRGTRLKQLTDCRAKPAVPFAGKLKIIDFSLSNCINSGIRRVSVLTQYKSQSLIRHITRGWGFLDASLREFVDVVPAQQQTGEGWYSGTANAVYQNLDMLREADPQFVLVLAGDHVYKMDYGCIVADHMQHGADVTIACIEVPLAQASDLGVIRIDGDHRVTGFDEKPAHPVPMPGRAGSALASMGIYVFNAAYLYRALTRDAADPASCHDFGHDIIPHAVETASVRVHDFSDSCVNMIGTQPYWRDVGTLDAFWEANMDLTRPQPELNLYDDAWPIRSLQHQLPPAKFVFDDDGRRGMAIDSLVSSGCIVSGAAIRRSLLFSKVRVGDGSIVEDSLLLPNVVVGRNVVLRRTIIDKHCVLPDGIKIGVHPDEDRARFTVTEKGVTLVTPQMLGQNVHARG
jgi:glucose-1-phosphate adenylyltransferase